MRSASPFTTRIPLCVSSKTRAQPRCTPRDGLKQPARAPRRPELALARRVPTAERVQHRFPRRQRLREGPEATRGLIEAVASENQVMRAWPGFDVETPNRRQQGVPLPGRAASPGEAQSPGVTGDEDAGLYETVGCTAPGGARERGRLTVAAAGARARTRPRTLADRPRRPGPSRPRQLRPASPAPRRPPGGTVGCPRSPPGSPRHRRGPSNRHRLHQTGRPARPHVPGYQAGRERCLQVAGSANVVAGEVPPDQGPAAETTKPLGEGSHPCRRRSTRRTKCRVNPGATKSTA